MKRNRSLRDAALAGAAAGLVVAALAACGSQALPGGPGSSATQTPAAAGFAGYKWTVVEIAHGGKPSTVPAGEAVLLQFAPNGDFGANEPVNYHFGTYAVTPGGFTTGEMGTTLVGYAGKDPSVLLAVDAISAFGKGNQARASVSGDTLTVTIGGYTLTAHRAGKQANFPSPQQTSGPPPQQASAQPTTAG
jgi:heat shock protein HslJ